MQPTISTKTINKQPKGKKGDGKKKRQAIVYLKNSIILSVWRHCRANALTTASVCVPFWILHLARRRRSKPLQCTSGSRARRVPFAFSENVNFSKCVTSIYFVCLRSISTLNLGYSFHLVTRLRKLMILAADQRARMCWVAMVEFSRVCLPLFVGKSHKFTLSRHLPNRKKK